MHQLMDEPLSSACPGKALQQSKMHWSGRRTSPFYSALLSAALLDTSVTTSISHTAPECWHFRITYSDSSVALWSFAHLKAEYPQRGRIIKCLVSVCKMSFFSDACKVHKIPVNIIFIVWWEEWTPPVSWVSARLDDLTETVVSVWVVGYNLHLAPYWIFL